MPPIEHTPCFRGTSIVRAIHRLLNRLLRVSEWHEGRKLGKVIRQLAIVAPMIERPPTADDDDTRSVLSRTAKLIIAIIVFAFGMLAGAAIAAWIMPPS